MYLAIDIGATKTLIALFSTHGRRLSRIKFLTNPNKNLFLSELKANLEQYRSKSITSVIIAVPCPVQNIYSITPPNLPWKSFDLYSPIKNLFTCPVFLKNDADLATLYESKNKKGLCVYLTFSTGIGAGLAKNGEILPASATFEPGHLSYKWDDRTYEWEDLAAASSLKSLYGRDVSKISSPAALETIAYRISIGLVDIINTYHPANIIIGGPLGLNFPSIRPYLIDYLKSALPDKKLPHITSAKRPCESVIYGCYLYGKSH